MQGGLGTLVMIAVSTATVGERRFPRSEKSQYQPMVADVCATSGHSLTGRSAPALVLDDAAEILFEEIQQLPISFSKAGVEQGLGSRVSRQPLH